MANNILKYLLQDYEQSRMRAERELEDKKELLYNKIPRLREIENELNSTAIKTAKNILNSNTNSLEELNNEVKKLKKEKIEILRQNGLSESYLKAKYNCEKCKDTGYILEDSKSVMCNCLKQKLLDISYNKSNISNLNKEAFENFDLDKFSDKIDFEKFNSKVSPRKNIEYIKKKCEEFVKEFDNPEGKNLLFTGNTGLGKTFMSNCIANEIIKKGKVVLYQTAPVLLDTIIKNKISKTKNEEQDEFYKNVLECDLLIIDDLGTEYLNNMIISELFTILNTRLLNSEQKVTKTIISTNLNIEQIFRNYEERIGSRIAGFYDIYYFFGDDLRLKRKSG